MGPTAEFEGVARRRPYSGILRASEIGIPIKMTRTDFEEVTTNMTYIPFTFVAVFLKAYLGAL